MFHLFCPRLYLLIRFQRDKTKGACKLELINCQHIYRQIHVFKEVMSVAVVGVRAQWFKRS